MNDRRIAMGEEESTPAPGPSAGAVSDLSLSVVIPVKDEEASVPVLVDSLLAVGREKGIRLVDIVVVDDGSSDGTWPAARALSREHAEVRALRLRRNFGKATALMVGAGIASGDIIVTMDGDLQDDPQELPRFVAAIQSGADLVSGWKKDRRDPLSKRLPSRIFNWATSWVSGIRLHDFNCGYKAYRREIFEMVELYGELHRYAPVLADALGYKVTEIVVTHHARRFGRSKYGVARFLRGFLDLLTVMMITRFAYRPSHLFGGLGTLLIFVGGIALTYLAALKLFTGAEIGDRPLLLLGALLAIIGVQLLLFGMLAELIISRSPRPASFQDLVAEEAGPHAPGE